MKDGIRSAELILVRRALQSYINSQRETLTKLTLDHAPTADRDDVRQRITATEELAKRFSPPNLVEVTE